MKKSIVSMSAIVLTMVSISCGKNFLEIKADKHQQIPSTITDYQALMDDGEHLMNISSSHELGLIGGDEYVISDGRYLSFPALQSDGLSISFQKNAYTWNRTIYQGGENTDWKLGYARILCANIVISGLASLKPSTQEQLSWNTAKGTAMFHRALNYYNMVQLYCMAYNDATAMSDPGLPLRLDPNVTEHVGRSSLKDTYELIIRDLDIAVNLLPELSVSIYRPGKAAAYALLAKTYMHIGNYEKAEVNAEHCLRINNKLLDFNAIDRNLRYTFPLYGQGNPEVLFMNSMSNMYILQTAFLNVDPSLLDSYAPNDLRVSAYFYNHPDGRISFKGSYYGSVYFFSGIATDEIYLIRAECNARLGDSDAALTDLNELLKHRIEKDTFVPLALTNGLSVLKLILIERRKELVFRGTRWEDLKRLNREHEHAKILTRLVLGTKYELLPNDKRYVWPLPLDAIEFGGYQQNLR